MKGHIYDISIEQCRDECKKLNGCGGFHWFPRNVQIFFLIYKFQEFFFSFFLTGTSRYY